MEVVPDEWLLDCLRPDDKRYSISRSFLTLLDQRMDKIVVRENSSFTKKLSKYAEVYPTEFKPIFWRMFDSDKVLKLSDDQILPLSIEIAPKIPNDDMYLVELVYSTRDKILVTTDTTLAEILRSIGDIRVFLFDEFMQAYHGK